MQRGQALYGAEDQRIFQPFYRIGNRLTEGVTGTGIGLSIARELARAHAGDLRLLAAPGGACFELTLRCPLQSDQE